MARRRRRACLEPSIDVRSWHAALRSNVKSVVTLFFTDKCFKAARWFVLLSLIVGAALITASSNVVSQRGHHMTSTPAVTLEWLASDTMTDAPAPLPDRSLPPPPAMSEPPLMLPLLPVPSPPLRPPAYGPAQPILTYSVNGKGSPTYAPAHPTPAYSAYGRDSSAHAQTRRLQGYGVNNQPPHVDTPGPPPESAPRQAYAAPQYAQPPHMKGLYQRTTSEKGMQAKLAGGIAAAAPSATARHGPELKPLCKQERRCSPFNLDSVQGLLTIMVSISATSSLGATTFHNIQKGRLLGVLWAIRWSIVLALGTFVGSYAIWPLACHLGTPLTEPMQLAQPLAASSTFGPALYELVVEWKAWRQKGTMTKRAATVVGSVAAIIYCFTISLTCWLGPLAGGALNAFFLWVLAFFKITYDCMKHLNDRRQKKVAKKEKKLAKKAERLRKGAERAVKKARQARRKRLEAPLLSEGMLPFSDEYKEDNVAGSASGSGCPAPTKDAAKDAFVYVVCQSLWSCQSLQPPLKAAAERFTGTVAVEFATLLAALEEEAQQHTGNLPSPSRLRTALEEQLILLTVDRGSAADTITAILDCVAEEKAGKQLLLQVCGQAVAEWVRCHDCGSVTQCYVDVHCLRELSASQLRQLALTPDRLMPALDLMLQGPVNRCAKSGCGRPDIPVSYGLGGSAPLVLIIKITWQPTSGDDEDAEHTAIKDTIYAVEQDIVVPNGPDEQHYQLRCMVSYVSGRYCAYTSIDGSWMRFDGLAAPLTIGSAWVMQASPDMLAVPSVLFYEAESAGALKDTARVRSGIEDQVSWKKANPAFRRKLRTEMLESLSAQISCGELRRSRNRELAIPPMLQLPTSDPHTTTGAAQTIPFDPVSCEPSPDGELPTITDCASPHTGEKESQSRANYHNITQAAAAARADAQLCNGAAEVVDPVARQGNARQVASMLLPSNAAGPPLANTSVAPSVAGPSGSAVDAGACGDAPAGKAMIADSIAGADAAAAADAAHEGPSVELEPGQPLGRTLHSGIAEDVAANAQPGTAASPISDSPLAAAPAGSAVDKAATGVSGLDVDACDDAPAGSATAAASDGAATGTAAADAADEAPGAELDAGQAINHLNSTGSSTTDMESVASSENLASLAPAATSAPVRAPAASTSAPTPPAASIAPGMPPAAHSAPEPPSANAPPPSLLAAACTEPAPASGGTAEQVEDVQPQAADELQTMTAAALFDEAEKYLQGTTDTPFGGTDAAAILSLMARQATANLAALTQLPTLKMMRGCAAPPTGCAPRPVPDQSPAVASAAPDLHLLSCIGCPLCQRSWHRDEEQRALVLADSR